MDQILIIDDDQEFADLLSEYLLGHGFKCLAASDGLIGLKRALEEPWDLILLDLMLPGKNGLELLRELRAKGLRTPVIMLTAKGEVADKIVGLEIGADDYLAKPFEPRELLARTRSVLRRARDFKAVALNEPPRDNLENRGQVEAKEGFRLDRLALKAHYGDRDLDLTPVEFKILSLLVDNLGTVIPRERLFLEGLGRGSSPFDRSLDIHLSRVRKKIWPNGQGVGVLKSVRGEGYILTPTRSE
ncbi:MAG: response regulator transcription factor [Deltaproteobacteria bacterium]|jgi:DNA-binding response OmpR family regulator|nr:response regulator transcription factor [Deltaproteobacteria bacterium]